MRIVRGASSRRLSERWDRAHFVRTSSKDAVGLTVTSAYRKRLALGGSSGGLGAATIPPSRA